MWLWLCRRARRRGPNGAVRPRGRRLVPGGGRQLLQGLGASDRPLPAGLRWLDPGRVLGAPVQCHDLRHQVHHRQPRQANRPASRPASELAHRDPLRPGHARRRRQPCCAALRCAGRCRHWTGGASVSWSSAGHPPLTSTTTSGPSPPSTRWGGASAPCHTHWERAAPAQRRASSGRSPAGSCPHMCAPCPAQRERSEALRAFRDFAATAERVLAEEAVRRTPGAAFQARCRAMRGLPHGLSSAACAPGA